MECGDGWLREVSGDQRVLQADRGADLQDALPGVPRPVPWLYHMPALQGIASAHLRDAGVHPWKVHPRYRDDDDRGGERLGDGAEAEPHLVEIAKALADLLEDTLGD